MSGLSLAPRPMALSSTGVSLHLDVAPSRSLMLGTVLTVCDDNNPSDVGHEYHCYVQPLCGGAGRLKGKAAS